jgi:hypothetical protein
MDSVRGRRRLPTTTEELSDRLRDPAFRAWLEDGLLRGTIPWTLEILALRLLFDLKPVLKPTSC